MYDKHIQLSNFGSGFQDIDCLVWQTFINGDALSLSGVQQGLFEEGSISGAHVYKQTISVVTIIN